MAYLGGKGDMSVRTPSIGRILLYFTKLRTYSLHRTPMKVNTLSVFWSVSFESEDVRGCAVEVNNVYSTTDCSKL